jgi:hypothetical protein
MTLPPNVAFSAQDNLLRARFRGPFKGLDTTSGLSDMDYNALRVARNINLEDNGAISGRLGTLPKLAAVWTNYRIFQGLTFTGTAGSQLIIAGRQSGANSGALGLVASDFSAVTTKTSGLNNQRPSLVSIKGLLFYYNGTDDFLYDGTGGSNPDEIRQIGITPPASAPTLASTANGSLVVGGSYQVAYTYYNNNTGEESSLSPVSAALIIAADPNDGITVTYVDGDVNTATHVNFYRTASGQPTLLFDKAVAVGAGTSTTLIQADAGLGREAEFDHTRPGIYGKFPYAWVAGNRVNITGRTANKNRVQLSAITSTGTHPEAFPAKNFADCESSRGLLDYNLGGGIAGDSNIVLKTNSIGRIENIGADDSTRADDPVLFNYKEISRDTTAVSMFASCNVLSEFIWLGRDNIYATDGVNIRRIADKIRTDILSFNLAISDDYSAFNDVWNQRILFTVRSQSTNTNPDYVIVGKYHNYPEFEWSYYTPADNETHVASGIQAACLFDTTLLANGQNVLFGIYDYSGQLYQMNIGTKDANTYNISCEVEFAPVSYGIEEEEKLFIKDFITFLGGLTNQQINAYSIYDYSGNPIEPQIITVSGSGVSTWNDSYWLSGTWSSVLRLVTTVPHSCHNKSFVKQLHLSWLASSTLTILNYQTMARPIFWRG